MNWSAHRNLAVYWIPRIFNQNPESSQNIAFSWLFPELFGIQTSFPFETQWLWGVQNSLELADAEYALRPRCCPHFFWKIDMTKTRKSEVYSPDLTIWAVPVSSVGKWWKIVMFPCASLITGLNLSNRVVPFFDNMRFWPNDAKNTIVSHIFHKKFKEKCTRNRQNLENPSFDTCCPKSDFYNVWHF